MLMLLWEDHRLRKARSEDELRRDVERMQLEQLIGEGKALRQADEIRAYVSSVVDRRDAVPLVLDNGLDQWTDWARRLADRIEPAGRKLRGGRN